MLAVTVVVSTYNRPKQLSEVLDYLLQSDTQGLTNVEILVVDDGSPISVKSIVESKNVSYPFELKYIYQENAGPAAARNNGFQQAKNDLVWLVDDDVLVLPNLLKQHIEAHKQFPDSIIFGPYPYQKPEMETPAYRYMANLVDSGIDSLKINKNTRFIEADTVASGNISFKKELFGNEVYDSSLKTPVAEEFDLIWKLKKNKIPIILGFEMLAIHTQPIFISDKCKQEYKYGVGISEVAIKNPSSLNVPALKGMYLQNCEIIPTDTFSIKIKKSFKFVLSQKVIKNSFLSFVTFCENILPFDKILFPLYHISVGVALFSGIRDGIKKFR